MGSKKPCRRQVSVIFGDGAGAACVEGVEADESVGVLASRLHAQGSLSGILTVVAPTSLERPRITPEMLEQGLHYPHMDGPTVFKHAVRRLPEVAHEVLAAAGVALDEIDLVVPHQANLRINQFVAQHLGIPDEKVVHNIQRYGNTTAASIPIAFDEALEAGRLPAGGTVLFLAFGAGLTWAGSVYRAPR